MTPDIPTLTKRKLQAQVIGPIYAEMVAEIGEEKAARILDTNPSLEGDIGRKRT